MSVCNNAFADLAQRMEDILSSSFDESPRGDKGRVINIANKMMKLLSNSYYSLSYLNA
jgi:hypothetical protein